MIRARVIVAIALALALATGACKAQIAGPADDHAARDRATGDDLARVVGALPGATRVAITLHTPWRDPLAAPAPPERATATVAIAAGPDADAAGLERDTRRLIESALPGAAIAIAVRPIAPAPTLAAVGPFQVASGSRLPLILTLAFALIAIAGLATWVVLLDARARRRRDLAG
ncbi:MAG: hypothetical protein K8W52_40535 [Deltaproteobacteria bacterium]|nr:hypothetical protein [Deltaproteobacteria bacterium]